MDLVKMELAQIRKAYRENRKSVMLKAAADYVVPSEDDAQPF